jgi:hypothetical protein
MRNASRHFARIETQACRDLVAGPKLFADTPRGCCPWTVGGIFLIQDTGTVGLDRVGSVGLCVSDAVAVKLALQLHCVRSTCGLVFRASVDRQSRIEGRI